MNAATKKRFSNRARIATVGIDVGGERKGFHAVALTGGSYSSHLSTKSVPELARWCRETVRPRVIAVDAPCGWSKDGHYHAASGEECVSFGEPNTGLIIVPAHPIS